MKAMLLLAVLLAPALLAAPARAADPALVTGVEKYLRDDEKALLAALLVRPGLSAEFDAEAPLALKNPKNLGPFLGVWRGKLEAFAETDAKSGDPNLDGRYSSYAQLMTPEQRAYMVRRLPTMKEDDRNSLIDYLKKVNDALAKYGELTWYTKKVVSGIMDHYRTDLSGYVATPMAQTAKRDAAASLLAFAAIKKADEDARLAAAKPVKPAPVEVADAPAAKPARKPAPATKPAPAKAPAPATKPAAPVETGSGSVVATKPAGGALQQAQDVVDNGAQGGAVMDGGAPAPRPSSGGAVIVPPSNGGARPPELPLSKPGSEAGLTATLPEVPSPVGSNDMDALLKMQTKPAKTPWINHVPTIAGGLLGGILGGILGFLVGGPIGAIVGAAAGAAAGAAGGHLLAKKLFQ